MTVKILEPFHIVVNADHLLHFDFKSGVKIALDYLYFVHRVSITDCLFVHHVLYATLSDRLKIFAVPCDSVQPELISVKQIQLHLVNTQSIKKLILQLSPVTRPSFEKLYELTLSLAMESQTFGST